MIENYNCLSGGRDARLKNGVVKDLVGSPPSASTAIARSVWLFLLTLLFMVLPWQETTAQSITNYVFSSNATGSLTDLSSGATNTAVTGRQDDAATAVHPIGFDYWFMGVRYTHFSANTNGQFRLHTSASDTAIGSGAIGYVSGTATFAPMGGDNELANGIRFKVIGTAPNRKLVIEWNQFYAYWTDINNAGNMQASLDEATGAVQYVYGEIYNSNSSSITRSIFISAGNTTTTAGHILVGTSPSFVPSTSPVTNTFAAGNGTTTASPLIANLGSSADGSRRVYNFLPPVPTAASGLTFASVTGSSMTLNWADNSSNENGFTILRSTDNVNFTVVTSTAANAITYNATGLSFGTTYYWKVVPFKEAAGGAATASQATTAGTISGIKTVGTSGDYTNLTSAFAAINSSGLNGNVELQLISGYPAAAETFPIASSPASITGAYTIKIYPTVAGLSITSAAASTFNLNGTGNLTIDGRVNQTGTTADLVIANTSTSGAAVQFVNDASNNTIKYCSIQGVNTGTSSGVVVFGTTTGTTGNDNNTIANCDIRDGASQYVNGIYSSAASLSNDNNTISNNNIYNFFSATAATNGILVATGNSAWTISGNSFYQTASRTYTSGNTHTAINITNSSNGSGYIITGNYIGGSAPSAGGAAYTMLGAVSSTFRGIALSAGTTTASSVQGNFVKNISFATSNSTTSLPGSFTGINVSAGLVNVGTVTGNTIGETTGTGSIVINPTSTTAFAGIYATSSSILDVRNNQVGSISTAGAAAIGYTFYGVAIGGSASHIVSSNTVGSATTANSIALGTAGTTTASETFYGIYSAASGSTLTMNSNIVKNNTLNTTGSITFYGVYSSSTASTLAQNSNVVSDNKTTGASGTIYGIAASTSTYTANLNQIYNLGFTANSGTSSSTIYGYYNLASPSNETINGNEIYNLSIAGATTSTGSGIGGVYTNTATGTRTVSGNKIYGFNFTNSASGSATLYGIYSANSSPTVFKNKIYNLNATNGAASVVYGVYFSSGTTNLFYNNYIGNLTAPASSLTAPAPSVVGLYISGGTTVNVYHNTISIGGSINSSAAVYATTSPTTLNMRNNIFVNTATSGTGKTAAYQRASTTLTNYAATSNNNVFYAGTPSANNLIYYDGTNADQTLAAYKTRMATRDQLSYSEAPTFVSTTGSDATYLHISTTAPTQIESGGTAIAAVTTDFDDDVRNATTPDVGADEFAGVGADLTNPVIVYTALTSSCALGARTLTATITDAGSGVATAGAGLPVLYWKANSGAYTAVTGTSIGSNQYTFTFAGSAVSGDVISYYIVAQDNAATPNVVASPSTGAAGYTASPPAAATPPTTPESFSFPASFSGNYNVGAGQTFTTLTAAINAYSTRCLSGPVTFTLTDTNYSTAETFPLVIANTASSSTNTLTIKPATTATITGTVASGSLITINGAKYVTIDGSNSGGTDKSLTITNAGTTSPTAITISSLGLAAGATNNTVKNCNISTGLSTSIGYGISVGAAAGVAGADNDNVTLQNNVITVASVGIYASGTTAVSAGALDNLNIVGNSITNNVSTTCFGIRVANALNSTVNNNTINIETSSTTQPVGIALETGFLDSSVLGNKITKVLVTATNGYGGRGITVGTGTATSNLVIANNSIVGVNGSNYTGFDNSSSMGIAVGVVGNSTTISTTTGGVKLYYNSINMAGSHSYAGNTLTAALYVGSGVTALDVRNNVLVNSLNNTSSSGTSSRSYAIYSAAANTAFTSINYNDYFVSGTQGMLGYIGSNRAALADIVTGFGQNANSLAINPQFNSATNLQPQSSDVIAKGTAVSGVTTDILGVSRNATTPSMGAYEEILDVLPPTITYTALTNSCTPGARTLTATITDLSGIPTSGAGLPVLYWKTNSGAYTASTATSLGSGQYQFSLGAGSGSGDTVSYYIVAQDMAAIPNVVASPATGAAGLTSTPPAAGTAPTAPSSYVNAGGITGVFTVGAGGNYPTLTAAVAAYNVACLGGPITLSLTDATYSTAETFPIVINNQSSTAVNTLTIKPAAGVNATISGALNTFGLIQVRSSNVFIDGSNAVGGTSRNLTITNTSTTAPQVISMGSATVLTNVTVKNTSLINGASTGTAFIITDAAGAAGTFNNITIRNNSIKKAYYGIYALATVAAGNGNGLLITENQMDATGTDAIRIGGIYVQGADGATVSNNTISNIANANAESPRAIWMATSATNATVTGNTISNCSLTSTGAFALTGINFSATASGTISNNTISNLSNSGTAASFGAILAFSPNTNITNNTVSGLTQNASTAFWGIAQNGAVSSSCSFNTVSGLTATTFAGVSAINIQGVSTGVTLESNKVSNIKNTYSSGGYPAQGIVLSSSSTTADILAKNNMVWDVATFSGSSSIGSNAVGIYVSAGAGYKVYNNTVHLGTQLSASGTVATAAFAVGSSVTTAGALDVRNNIFANTQTTSTTGCYAIYSNNSSNTIFSAIDYNDYWSVGTNLGYISSARATLANVVTGFGGNVNSKNIKPNFVGANDVHLNVSTNSTLDNVGVAIAGVTTDIDGDTRSATPDMGADEFTTLPCSTANGGTATPTAASFCTTGTTTVAATGYSIGSGTTYEWQKSVDLAFTTPVSMAAASDTYADLTTGTITATTYYRLKVVCSAGAATYSTVATVTVYPAVNMTVSPSIAICADNAAGTVLTATGASTYAWSPATGLSATTGSSVTAHPAVTTTYTVVGTDANLCTATKTVTVTVDAPLTGLNIDKGTGNVCSGSVIALTASVSAGAAPYEENFASLPAGFSATNTDGTGSVTLNTTYYSSGTSSVLFTTASTSANVQYGMNTNYDLLGATTAQLKFNHIAAMEGPSTSYDYGYVDYSTNGGTTWTVFPASSYAGAGTLASASGVGFSTKSYPDWITAFPTSADVPTNALWKTETINIPAAALTSQFRIRFRYTTDGSTNYYGWLIDDVKIAKTSIPSYVWTPQTNLYTDAAGTVPYTGTATAVIYARPATSSTYTVTAALGACSVATSTTINPTPLPTFTVADAATCKDTPVTITVNGPGNSYSWSPATYLNTTAGATVIATPSVTTTYTVLVTDNTTLCQTTKQVVVTVNQPVDVTSITPLNPTVLQGQSPTFTVAATGTGLTYQWQEKAGDGASWAPITDLAGVYSGATTAVLHVLNVSGDFNGYQYKCVVSGATGCTADESDVATLTIDTTGITTHPHDTTTCAGSSFSFTTVAVSEDPEQEITYYWEVGRNGVFHEAADGFDSLTGLTFDGTTTPGVLVATGATTASTGLVFHSFVNGYIPSSDAVLTVLQPVTITTPPAAKAVCAAGGTTTFSVVAAGAVTTYQWQYSTDNATWGSVQNATPAGATYSGAATAILSVTTTAATPATGVYYYRAVANATSPCMATASAGAQLLIDKPVVDNQPVAQSVTAGGSATFTAVVSGVVGAPTYQWQYATTAGGTYANVVNGTPVGVTYTGATTNSLGVATTTNTLASTSYYYKLVTTSPATCSVTTNAAQFTVINYCTPANATSSTNSYIDTFTTTGGATNISNAASGFSVNGYGNFTNLSASQIQGGSVSFSSTTQGNTVGTTIWVDWNHDLAFDASEKMFTTTDYGSNPSGSFVVPSTATLGSTRMRVFIDYNSVSPANSCGPYSSGRGETEDYTFTVLPPPPCSGQPDAGLVLASTNEICVSGPLTLTAIGYTTAVSGISFQWYNSAGAISGATSPVYTNASVTATSTYYLRVTCANSGIGVNTPSVTVTVNNPTVLTTTPGTRCGIGSVALAATASAGSTLKWYDSATSTTVLGTGTSFPTPSITATTTYYVGADVNGAVESIGKPSSTGSDGSTTFTDYGVVFDASSNFKLNSAVVYPTGTGTITIALRDATGTELAVTPAIALTGTGIATPVTLPLNFNVSAGSGYRLVVKAYTGITGLIRDFSASYPYASTHASVVGSWSGSLTTGSNYFLYNLQLTVGCLSPRTAVTATVTTAPTLAMSRATSTICTGTASTPLTVTQGQSDYTSYVWTPAGVTGNGTTGFIFNPTVNTTYTLTATTAAGCTSTLTHNVIVNPLPSAVTVTPATTAICAEESAVALTAAGGSSAGTVTSGVGTSTTTGNTTGTLLGPNPLQHYYGGSKQQWVYRATELTALGFVAGTKINAIALNLAAADGGTLSAVTVKMKNSATQSFASTTAWETGMTEVISQVSYTTVVGLNNFVLPTPFEWNGTSSLVIEMNYSDNNGGSGSTNTAKYSATTFASTIFYRVDSTPAATINAYTGTATSTYSSRNDVTFTFVKNQNVTWTPTTGLYTNAAASTPYTGGAARVVYAKPSQTTTYSAVATTTEGCPGTAGSATITIKAPSVGGTVAGSGSVCSGTNTTALTLSDYTGAVVKWQSSTSSTFASAVTDIANTTASLTASNLTQTTYYRAVVSNQSCATANSNIATVTVNQFYNFYADNDGDGYGAGATVSLCSVNATTAPAGYSVNNTDCDDEHASVHPGATEIPFDGLDNDCNNIIDDTSRITTKLTTNSCGATLAAIGSLIQIQPLSGQPITGYIVRVTNGAQVQTITKTTAYFNLRELPQYDYATTYTIDIQLIRNGVALGYYGETCLVSTPAILVEGGATAVNPSQCGTVIPTVKTLIYTTSLASVTGYRFRVSELNAQGAVVYSEVLDRPYQWFSLSMMAQYRYNAEYRVEVAVKTTGDYSSYGSPCTIYAPRVSMTSCDITIPLASTQVKCTAVTGATQYRFQLTRVSDLASVEIDRGYNYFTFGLVPNYTRGAVYMVRVAVMTTGVWSAFSDGCEITAPGGTTKAEVTETALNFNAVAHPNPFASDFGINVTTSNTDNLQVRVYDMLGKLIEAREVKVSELEGLKVGDRYAAGVYNVIVTQGVNVKTLRVIKR